MDFAFNPEQQELRAALRDVAADRCSPAQLRDAVDNHEAYDEKLWRLLAGELGLVGVAVSEPNGGMGGGFVDAAVALEEAGAALFPAPLLTSIVGAVSLDRAAVGPDVVAAIASGERGVAVAVAPSVAAPDGQLTGEAVHVLDARHADVLVVAASDGLWLTDRSTPGVMLAASPSLDLTRWQATVRFDGAAASRLGDEESAARLVDLLRVGLAVESVGVARRCLASTVDYLKTRVQFGKPIGSFQALQHRAADLAVDLEAATSTAYYAAWVAADSPNELPIVAPLAKAVCTDAAYRIASETIQIHGGIGFTWEHDAHLYFKRATASRLLLGDAHEQRRLVADRAELRAGPVSL
jgi:alkylation response protein AidB-like acyl-CoA dehydrogenase